MRVRTDLSRLPCILSTLAALVSDGMEVERPKFENVRREPALLVFLPADVHNFHKSTVG